MKVNWVEHYTDTTLLAKTKIHLTVSKFCENVDLNLYIFKYIFVPLCHAKQVPAIHKVLSDTYRKNRHVETPNLHVGGKWSGFNYHLSPSCAKVRVWIQTGLQQFLPLYIQLTPPMPKCLAKQVDKKPYWEFNILAAYENLQIAHNQCNMNLRVTWQKVDEKQMLNQH